MVARRNVAVLLLLAPSTASQVPDDKLIVPGQRIGKWTLEMNVSDLVSMNGRPQSVFQSTSPDLAVTMGPQAGERLVNYLVGQPDLLRDLGVKV